ncbi:MAG: acyl-CoA dehydratase activase [Coriobacteriaceae bacterium]|nr:acyl-CoA dehydratase activase [Coriobacteriaceae bacterium]
MAEDKKYRVGIDIGSTATKAAVLAGDEVIFTTVVPTGFSSVDAAERVRDEVVETGFAPESCRFAATGYGRISAPFAETTVTEITCHGRGAFYLFESDGVVIDIGGQDTKTIVLEDGKVAQFAMNDKCSAGTGKFLEIMANRMGIDQDKLSRLARTGSETRISSMCTVFAESEVISLIGKGTPRADIAWGIIESVVGKVAPLVPKIAGADYFLTGGLCENDYVIERLSAQLGSEVITNPQARFAGAIGAALAL